MNHLELAWAAGFFDGEGTTLTTQSGASLQLTVPQVDIRPLRRFVSAVGETMAAVRNVSPRGPISRQRIHVFRVYNPRALAVVRKLFPWLSEPKQNQALTALLKYGFRSVGRRAGLSTCARGHSRSDGYVAPDGSIECAECRRLRRRGPLAHAPRQTAIAMRIDVREFVEQSYQPVFQS